MSVKRLALLFGLGAVVAVGVVAVYVAVTPPPDRPPPFLVDSSNGDKLTPSLPAVEDDPARDGWQTEVLSQAAANRLEKLKPLFALRAYAREAQSFVDDGISTDTFRPRSLRVVLVDDGLVVRRDDFKAGGRTPSERAEESPHHGPHGLMEAAQGLMHWLVPGSADRPASPRVDLKVFRVRNTQAGVETDVLFSAYSSFGDARRQAQAVWRCRWTGEADSLKLVRIGVAEYEEIEVQSGSGWSFSDCTAAALPGETHREQFQFGIEAWLDRTVKGFDRVLWGDQGIACGDANGDGLDDVYICELGSLPNRLFIHHPNGTAIDEAQRRGVDFLDHSRSALFVDLDNDADQDLLIATSSALLLMENDGSGRFQLRNSRDDVPDAHSLAAADYDRDGRLDVFACGYHKERHGADEYPFPVPYHDAKNGGRNILLRNLGGWKFADTTAAAGLDQNNHRWSLAAAWEDHDNDGDLDLYVANDFGPNNLFRNDGRRFTDVTADTATGDVGSGMSVAWGDYDNDGLMDLYVSNMFSTAGSRIAHQRQFRPGGSPESRALFQRMAKGNTLFRNRGGGTFDDVSRSAAVDRARWAWGAKFIDLNNDAWEDLVVANGFVTRDDKRDL